MLLGATVMHTRLSLAPSPCQAAAATPLTPLVAAAAHPNPSPLRRRGYFTDVHGAGTFSRVPSLFGRAGEDRTKPVVGGTSLPQVGARVRQAGAL